MTPGNRAGVGKSRRGPGRRLSRLGWGPLLFRVSRYFTDSTGGAAGKGFAEENLTAFPCGEPRGGPGTSFDVCGRLAVEGQVTYSPLAEKVAKTAFF